MMMMKTVHLLSLLLVFFGSSIAVAALNLPRDFTIQPNAAPQPGFDLVWSSASVKVQTGASRYEFRFPDGSLLGYPREVQGVLRLPLTSVLQNTLSTQDAASLQVWVGRKRIDGDAFLNVLGKTPAAGAAAVTAASTPTVDTNPAQKGSYTTRRANYTLADLVFDEYGYPVEVLAEVTDAPSAPGKRPLVLFLHGRHAPCYIGGPNGTEGDWPCLENGYLPIPSHQGYRYVTDILASQGYIAVSISANGINGQDWNSEDAGTSSRSFLIHHHLKLWAQWNANGGSPWGDRFKGRVDMTKVVLVGHSRGGEGVQKAAVDAAPSDPYQIVGLVTYGPTAFGRQMTPDVHSANILPTCDGDVSDLQGQAYVDNSRDLAYSEALRSAVISVGTNHNFFNTEWTPGFAVAPAMDDWEYYGDQLDPVCGRDGGGSVRLSAVEQQVVGATYTLALVKLAVNQDASMLPLLDGSYVRPKAIGRAEVATSAVGGAKNRVLYRAEDAGRPTFRNGMTGRECLGNPYSYSSINPIPICASGAYFSSPHWLPINSRPSTLMLELQWTVRPSASAQFNVAAPLRNLTTLDYVDVRIANDPNNNGVRFNLVLADQSGKNATMTTSLTTIEGWPGEYNLDRVHARTLRGSLASVRSQLDLGRITAVFLVARSATGRVWVLDVAASQARIQVPAVLNLPKLWIESGEFLESDGLKQYKVNILADRPLTTNASIWVESYSSSGSSYRVNLVPGTTNVVGSISFDYVGDNIYSYSSFYESFAIEAIKGVVIGDYTGYIAILEDEPTPKASAKASNVTATEGKSLKWTVQLSAPTAGTTLYFTAVKPKKGKELTSRDVASSWLASAGVYSIPSTPVPLSELGLYIEVRFGYGIRSVDLLIPLVADGVGEGNEVVAIEKTYDDFGDLLLTGNVVDKT